MKRKIFSVLFALVLALSLCLVTAVPAAATTYQVNPGESIQAAIDAASSGDIITVAAGTYNEDITIDKTLTLEGAQAGENARGRTGPESIINAQGVPIAVLINGADTVATFDGFRVVNYDTIGILAGAFAPDLQGVPLGDDPVAVHLLNNIIKSPTVEGPHNNNIQVGGGTTGTVIGNEVSGALLESPDWSGSGILVASSNNVVISNNYVHNSEGGIQILGYVEYQGRPAAEDNVIKNNLVEGNECGISVQGNSIGTIIRHNDVLNNDVGIGSMAYDLSWPEHSTPSGTQIHYNNIDGNLPYGVESVVWGSHTGNVLAEEVNATSNWWGDVTGPTHASNTNGTGDPVTDYVAYSPWLGATIDISPMTFIVDDVGPEPVAGYIQTAIKAASSSDTIKVAAGTYNEVVTIDKSLTLLGAKAGMDARTRDTSSGESILDGQNLGAGTYGDPRAGFWIGDAVSDVIIDGFEIKGYLSRGGGHGSAILVWRDAEEGQTGVNANIIIRNNYLHNLGWNGICVGTGGNGLIQTGFTIQFNLIEEAPYAGIELTNTTSSTVKDNKIIAPTVIIDDPYDAGVGIEVAVRAQAGITISAGTDILVEGNEITGAFPSLSRAGINILSRTYASDSNATLTGVTVRSNTVSGVTNIWAAILAVAESRDGGPATITSLAVEDNILVGNSWAGIWVDHFGGGTLDSITVSGNTLENNLAHVYDSWEDVLDIQRVLENNTFDRTVVIDHLGQGSLHHWIFGSIAEAVGSAYDGDTVLASAGIYDEQVVISRLLTLQGAGDATVIKPSSESKLKYCMGLNGQPGALFNNHSVAGIVNAKYTLAPGLVIIKDLMVDGGDIDVAPYIVIEGKTYTVDYIAGIFGLGMNGIIDNVTVVNMGTSTEQPRTYGMWLDSVIWDASVEVKNCTITGYNKNGINARGALQNVDIHDNTITGGPSDIQVPNGILLLNGVTGEVNNNTISNMAYTPEISWSAGIMFWESSGSANGNTITDCQIGVLYQDGGGTAQGNTVNGGTVGLVGLWAQYLVPGAWDVSFVENTVSVANDDTYHHLENAAIGVQTVDAGASINATITGNQVTGNEGTSADGIIIGDFSQPGNITATITNNTVSRWQHGIRLVSSVAAGSTITGNNITNNISPSSGIHIEAGVDATSVSVNFNDIVGNQGYGVYNGGNGILDATTNWWGDASGPYHATTNLDGLGNAVSDNVDFDPWLYPPTVVNVAASSLRTTSATLNGSLDDLGSALSVDVSFEWGRTTAYGDTTAVVSVGQTGDFSATISGLSPSTTYHFRVKAMGDGPDVYGDDITFTTKKKVTAPTPTYYTETSLFGIEASFRISSSGKILEAIVATSEDENLIMTIPEGTITLDKEGERLETLEAVVDETPPDPPEDAHIIGLAYDFGPDGATFDPPITLEYSYDPEALPEGVDEEDLVLAYYDEEAGEWVELDCVVDIVNNTITASVAHFTTFAIIGIVTPPPPPPAPAAFSVASLSIQPAEVEPSEAVTITVLVTNTGGEAGSYQVNLVINDLVEATKEATVRAGLSKEVPFSVTKEDAGSYSVVVDGLSGGFTVVPVVAPPAPAAFSVSRLSFQPAEVEAATAVTIAVLVSNTGGMEGSYTVVLKVNGVKEAEKTVTIVAGDSQEVSFSLTRDEPGTYSVSVDGLSGGFTVIVVTPPPGVNWPAIGGGIAGGLIVVGLLYYFLVFRRRAY